MDTGWIGVKLYTQTQLLTGFVYQPPNTRLLDILNGGPPSQAETCSTFLELSRVTIFHPDGIQERLPAAYISKAAIQVAAPQDGDVARGIGAEAGPKRYPYVKKLPVQVSLHMAACELTGSMHRASGETVWDLLEKNLMFLPLTNAKVRLLTDSHWSTVPFVAANRAEILSLQEDAMIPDTWASA